MSAPWTSWLLSSCSLPRIRQATSPARPSAWTVDDPTGCRRAVEQEGGRRETEDREVEQVSVGYIGLGAMGGSLARHLVAGHNLAVYDLNSETLASFTELGARVAASSRDLAATTDIVIICLPRSSDVERLLFGENGIASALSPGQLIIDQTSGEPALTAKLAGRLAEGGVLYMDAPVSGGIPAAQNRSVTIIASGSEAAWTRGEVVLRAMSTKVFRCGARVGDGQAMKLVTNGIGACYRLATLEMATLWCRFGLPLEQFVAALNASAGANFTSRNMLIGLVEGRPTTNFSMPLMVKDLNGIIDVAARLGIPIPLTSTARSLMQGAIGLFGKEARLEDIVPFTEMLSSVGLRPAHRTEGMNLPSGLTPSELSTLLIEAIVACNVIGVLECTRVGLGFGLELEAIARVIDMGSAWSEVAQPLLSALGADGFDPGRYAAERMSLAATSSLARQVGLPFIVASLAEYLWCNLEISSEVGVGGAPTPYGTKFRSAIHG
ncbi:NAD(P)-binding domain-containing protein [Devosia sp. CN2-171]|uniref:NAD(P)-binding domain-containing protein n=1 Tax=Devosia sp. CN2-171 TaxID=3400909 RepID=UPI003BF7F77D